MLLIIGLLSQRNWIAANAFNDADFGVLTRTKNK